MKKHIILVSAALLLAACDSNTPVAVSTTVNGYEIKKLFTHEGCTMYRVYDLGTSVRYVKCENSRYTSTQYNCGKGCTAHIETVNKDD